MDQGAYGLGAGGGVGEKHVCSVWREYRGILFADMRQDRRARPRDDATKAGRVCVVRLVSCWRIHFRVQGSDVICASTFDATSSAKVDEPLQS